MPTADTVLLPLCVALTLVGLVITALAWRRGRRGRVVQGLGLAIAPVALYFTHLLRLVWDAVVAIVAWATRIVFSPTVWIGFALLGLCVVLWVVGGLIARHSAPARVSRAEKAAAVATGSDPRQVTAGKTQPAARSGRKSGAKSSAKPSGSGDVDPEMAEIEALLKSRGID